MKIAMIGAGYVGLTTGACLSSLGHHVAIFDVDAGRIARLRRGDVPIFEPGLDEAMALAVRAGRLFFCDRIDEAVSGAAAVFIAVGTPSTAEGAIDLRQVESAGRAAAPALAPGAVVVIKSTVVVGTCRKLREIIAEQRQALDFTVASNPEFLREGSAIRDFMRPDRVVFGFDDPQSGAVLDRIYAPLEPQPSIVRTTTANAELTKHAANAFLAMKIGFINDVADLCERVGADVSAIARAIGLDSRIGPSFLSAGPGFGGSCFPKDARAFAHAGRQHGATQGLIEAVIQRNEQRRLRLARRIVSQAELRSGDAVAILGVAFKANTDDIRESPAMSIAAHLARAGLDVRLHDPKAAAGDGSGLGAGAAWCDSPYEAVRGASAAAILTEWDDYAHLDLPRIAHAMNGPHLFDFRNLLATADVTAAGLVHHCVGRPSQMPQGPAVLRPRVARGGRVGAARSARSA